MTVQVHITNGPISPAQAGAEEAPSPTTGTAAVGAVLTFRGVVRRLEDDRLLTSIIYETYDPMAQLELERLSGQAVEKFGLLGLRLVHSRGAVPVGEASLFIAIRSTHRREGLDAMDWLIDQLKRDVPIWKHPQYADASHSPCEPGAADA